MLEGWIRIMYHFGQAGSWFAGGSRNVFYFVMCSRSYTMLFLFPQQLCIHWHPLFINWAEIKLVLFSIYCLCPLSSKECIFNFRESVLRMSRWVSKGFWWPWMNWDYQDLNCQTWSRYKKFLMHDAIWKKCWVMTFAIFGNWLSLIQGLAW